MLGATPKCHGSVTCRQLGSQNLQDVNEAMRRLPQEEQDLRMQRLKRAVDCSLKKQYLPKDVQAAQTPYNFYLDVSHPPAHCLAMFVCTVDSPQIAYPQIGEVFKVTRVLATTDALSYEPKRS
jgi:hypothetical protein